MKIKLIKLKYIIARAQNAKRLACDGEITLDQLQTYLAGLRLQVGTRKMPKHLIS